MFKRTSSPFLLLCFPIAMPWCMLSQGAPAGGPGGEPGSQKPAAQAQTQAQTSESGNGTVFQTNARAVLVDLVVTDRSGKSVSGLRQEDIKIDEDGHPQKVAFFEAHSGTPAPPVPLPDLPQNFFTNVPRVKLADSVTVLLLDSMNTPMQSQATVRREMFKYLKDPVAGRRMAIFTLGSKLRMIQGFTDDPATLAAVLKDLNRGAGPHTSDLLKTKAQSDLEDIAVDEIASAGSGTGNSGTAAALKQFFVEQTAAQADLRVRLTLEAFQELAHYLAAIPGRKNVAWFSGAFPLVMFADNNLTDSSVALGASPSDPSAAQRDYGDEVRKTMNLLAGAEVAIYPIAAEGLATDSIFEADQQMAAVSTAQQAQEKQGKLLHSDSIQRAGNQTSMEEIAKATGGQAFFNTNGISEALTKVASAGSSYYTLSYTPTNSKSDGRFRKIQVKLVNGNYKLSYRRGYFAATVKEEQKSASKPAADPLSAFLTPGIPDSTDVPMVLRVNQTQAPAETQSAKTVRAGDNAKLTGPLRRYSVDFIVAARGLKLDPSSDGGHHGNIEAALVVYDQGGHPLNWLERHVDLDIDAAHYPAVVESGVNFRLEIDAPKDGVILRSGVYDFRADQAGTLEMTLNKVIPQDRPADSKPR